MNYWLTDRHVCLCFMLMRASVFMISSFEGVDAGWGADTQEEMREAKRKQVWSPKKIGERNRWEVERGEVRE